MKIEEISNKDLLKHFQDAICDVNYNPYSEPYNKSGFTFTELRTEILNRMPAEKTIQEHDHFLST